MPKTYCPLMFKSTPSGGSLHYDCVKDECAWYDQFTGLCAILGIARFGGKGSFEIIREEKRKEKEL